MKLRNLLLFMALLAILCVQQNLQNHPGTVMQDCQTFKNTKQRHYKIQTMKLEEREE